MEQITLGEISVGLALIVGLIAGLIRMKGWSVSAVKEAIKDELSSLSEDINALRSELKKEDKEKTKNFLVARLSEIEKNETWSDVERQRFYEQYDHYVNDLNGNTYIRKTVERCEAEGKIWR